MKIIYIAHVPLSSKIKKHWLINDFKKAGIDCEYWDVGSIVRKNYCRDSQKIDNEIILTKISDFKDHLIKGQQKKTIYLMFFLPDPLSIGLYKVMNIYNCRTIFFAVGEAPRPKLSVVAKERIQLKELKVFFKRISYRIYYEVLMLYIKIAIKPIDLVFYAGSESLRRNLHCKKRVPINLHDNDTYLEAKNCLKPLADGKYILFLDGNMTAHPETPPEEYVMDPITYFYKMNRAFARIEDLLGMRVIVAEHPSSRYEKSIFEDREIYSGSTAMLVKDAEMVMGHMSTAISYAVLFEKPLILIKTDEMNNFRLATPLLPMIAIVDDLDLEMLGAEQIAKMENFKLPNVNILRYRQYKYKYLVGAGIEKIKNINNAMPHVVSLFEQT